MNEQLYKVNSNLLCVVVCFCACLFIFKPTPTVDAPAASVKFEGLTKTKKMKVKWTQVGLVFFLVFSLVMTGCFLWQYQLPKVLPGKIKTLLVHCLKY